MKKPKNLTKEEFWNANSSEERKEIVNNAFKWIEHLESKQLDLSLKGSFSKKDFEKAHRIGYFKGWADRGM